VSEILHIPVYSHTFIVMHIQKDLCSFNYVCTVIV